MKKKSTKDQNEWREKKKREKSKTKNTQVVGNVLLFAKTAKRIPEDNSGELGDSNSRVIFLLQYSLSQQMLDRQIPRFLLQDCGSSGGNHCFRSRHLSQHHNATFNFNSSLTTVYRERAILPTFPLFNRLIFSDASKFHYYFTTRSLNSSRSCRIVRIIKLILKINLTSRIFHMSFPFFLLNKYRTKNICTPLYIYYLSFQRRIWRKCS